MKSFKGKNMSKIEIDIIDKTWNFKEHRRKWYNKKYFLNKDIKSAWISFQLLEKRFRSRKDLNIDEMKKIALDNCPMCGSKMSYDRTDKSRKQNQMPSIDRIIPDGDYTQENCWIICKSCNLSKGNERSPLNFIDKGLKWYFEVLKREIEYE